MSILPAYPWKQANIPETGIAIFWFRRDLRLEDNVGLNKALRSGMPVLPVFLFDREILDQLEERKDRRVSFLHREVQRIAEALEAQGSSMLQGYGNPKAFFEALLDELPVKAVYTNKDYEPYARDRDEAVADLLQARGAHFCAEKDHVIFEQNEVVKADGKPYTIYTPYKKLWLKKLHADDYREVPVSRFFENLLRLEAIPPRSLEEMGFQPDYSHLPPAIADPKLIGKYDQQRDLPAVEGTTKLGMHLRFGTVSTRRMVDLARKTNDTWLSELIWREFFAMILWHFPHTVTRAFKPAYDQVKWRNDPEEFEAWKKGKTGFPIVDAGMRQLNETGFMHNRVRMITASFLIKDLLVDWRWGEAYFAERLIDFDLAANVGNWQWAAGSGCDAAPYFRIFNPERQTDRFDPEKKYIQRWIPEFGTKYYPNPIVDHAFARNRTLDAYKLALGKVAAN